MQKIRKLPHRIGFQIPKLPEMRRWTLDVSAIGVEISSVFLYAVAKINKRLEISLFILYLLTFA